MGRHAEAVGTPTEAAAAAPRYPAARVHVDLSSPDGNAFAIVGLVVNAIRAQGAAPSEVLEFRKAAISGTYRDVLDTCRAWCNFTTE